MSTPAPFRVARLGSSCRRTGEERSPGHYGGKDACGANALERFAAALRGGRSRGMFNRVEEFVRNVRELTSEEALAEAIDQIAAELGFRYFALTLGHAPPPLTASGLDMRDGHPAVIPQITGMAYRCGTSEFTLDPRDPFVAGFVLR